MKNSIAITVRMPPDLHSRIEAARGRTPREAWARDAFEQRLAAEALLRFAGDAREDE